MGILFGPPGTLTIMQLRGLPYTQYTPTLYKPQGHPPVEISQKKEIWIGSSSSAALLGTALDDGVPLRSAAWYINQWKSEASTKLIEVYANSAGANIDNVSDSQLGNASGTQTGSLDIPSQPWLGAVARGNDNENYFVQMDTNNSGSAPSSDPGSPDVHYSWLKGTGAFTNVGTHKGVFAQLNPLVASEKRFVAWNYSDWSNGYLGGWGWFNTARAHRLVWGTWPGCHVDESRYWQFVPPSTSTDIDPNPSVRRNGATNILHFFDDWDAKIYENMRLPTYMIGDRSHLNPRGYALLAAMWMYDCVEARQGIGNTTGAFCPWFSDHRYYVDTVAARTNGGAVCTLGYQGTLVGWNLSLIDCATGSASADFAIDSSANITRIGTGGTINTKDLLVVCNNGWRQKWYHIEIGVSPGTTPKLCTLDGNFGLSMFSTANTGTLDAPVYAANNVCLTLAGGVSSAAAEGTFLFVLQPDADVDTVNLQLVSAITSSVGIIAISRASNGSISITLKSSTGVSLGNVSSNTSTGRVRNSDGLTYVAYSFSIANNRQALTIYRDAGAGAIGQTATNTVNTAADARLNPLAGGNAPTPIYTLFSGGQAANQAVQVYKGLAGPTWFAEKEIQFDATNIANFGLFRAGAGLFQDLGTSGTVTPLSGANTGTPITPYVYLNGVAPEMVDGNNRGYGGQFESWSRRDWSRLDWTKGQPHN